MIVKNFIKLAVVLVIAFFAILSDPSSNNARYVIFQIPYHNEIMISCLVFIIASSASSVVVTGRIMPIIPISLISCSILLTYSRLVSEILGRSDVQYDYFLIATTAGICGALGRYRKEVKDAIVYALMIICLSVLILAFLPKYFGILLIYDPNVIGEIGFGTGSFHKNSGILLNNNTFGAMMSIAYAYILYFLKNDLSYYRKYTLICVLFCSIILSGNATSLIISAIINIVLLYHSIKRQPSLYLITSFIFLIITVAVVFLGKIFEISYLRYKLKSGEVKIDIFADNLNDFFGSIQNVIAGHKNDAFLSESTFIDLLYYFGLPLIIVFIFGLIYLALLEWSIASNLKETVTKIMYILVILFLIFAQNSAVMIGPSFIMGFLIGTTILSWKNRGGLMYA